jgi:(p)ppGpp synthase/HD superfamily hydrolase
MRYTYAIEKAIRAAAVLHAGQVRKGPVPYPYITHVFAVAMIVCDYTDDENTITAALLHETLSDTDYTPEELEDDFGGAVKDIVYTVTEPHMQDFEHKLFLDEQKKFVKGLRDASPESCVVLAAAKIHTMRTLVEEYVDNIPAFIADYGPNQDAQILFYQEVSNALNRKLTNDILAEFNDVFTEYKNFIYAVKEKTENY